MQSHTDPLSPASVQSTTIGSAAAKETMAQKSDARERSPPAALQPSPNAQRESRKRDNRANRPDRDPRGEPSRILGKDGFADSLPETLRQAAGRSRHGKRHSHRQHYPDFVVNRVHLATHAFFAVYATKTRVAFQPATEFVDF